MRSDYADTRLIHRVITIPSHISNQPKKTVPKLIASIFLAKLERASLKHRFLTKVSLTPPKNGTLFRIVDFVPTTQAIEQMPVDTMMKVAGVDAPKKGLPPRHSMMHRTRTVDYAIVMSGEIDMLLDEGEVHLKAGDVVVQQATNHAWVNRGKEICRVAFIL
ncbi:MAG TPA: cupin domain-containing protein, partial [Pseudolabrys sp.]|nr:cupin domain-containing protein [Pseudolabrys sp.]